VIGLLILSVSVFPLQIGVLEVTTGVAGELGSANTTGPAILEGQPFNVAVILE
jgi:hypothetical protein